MLQRIINILREVEVSDYRISEVKTVSHQAYFIKQALDQI